MEAVTVASRRRTHGDRVSRTTDDELIRRIVERDTGAFAQLVRRHGPKVQGLARRVLRHAGLAEDVTRESFLQVWQLTARYSPDRGSVEVWLMSIAHRTSVDRLRRIQTQRPLAVVPPEEIAGGRSTGDLVARMDRANRSADDASRAHGAADAPAAGDRDDVPRRVFPVAGRREARPSPRDREGRVPAGDANAPRYARVPRIFLTLPTVRQVDVFADVETRAQGSTPPLTAPTAG